jgi:hypothetical protein
MGTRNLTFVVYNNEIKVAQYCQWDGNPSGNGSIVVNFICKKINTPKKLEAFKQKLSKINYLTSEEVERRYAELKNAEFLVKYPQLHRNFGPRVLDEYILITEEPELQLMTEFAAESLFCEWAYVIDLDNCNLEVYKGFNKKKLTKKDRFAFLPLSDNGYKQIKILASIPFAELNKKSMNKLEK